MKPEIYMSTTWEEATILAIVIFLFAIALLISFGYLIILFRQKTQQTFENLANQKGEILINIKSKVVQKKIIDNKGREERIETYPLDDFIYMLSLNPETKTFREVLKLINNGESKNKIINKFKTITESKMIFKLTYSQSKYSIAFAELDLEQKSLDEFIQLQINESFVLLRKKETIPDIFTEKTEFLDDHKLFQAISKEVKSIKTKGWTIVKIYNRNASLSTDKDFWINIIQLSKLKILLKNENVPAFFDLNGNMFLVQTSGRNSNHFSILKTWNNKINNVLIHKTKINYLDVVMDDLVVITANDQSKDSKSINLAMIKLQKLSEGTHSDRGSKRYLEAATSKAIEIHANGNYLVKLINDNKFPIQHSEFEVKERAFKGIVEYYIDMEAKIVGEVMSNSYQHKKDIVAGLIKDSNKRSSKQPEKINTVMLDISTIPLISKVLSKSEMKPNFYLSFNENENETYSSRKYADFLSELNEEGFKLIQLVRDIDEGSLSILRDMKPEFVLYTRDFAKVNDPNERVRINLAKINLIKDKGTKILNIK